MAKIMIECGNPNDFSEIVEAAERAAGSCTVTYAKVAQEKIEAGQARSVLDAAKQIAPETGESVQAVRRKIQEGQKKVAQDGQLLQPAETTAETTKSNEIKREPAKDGTMRGGRREGAGRKPSVSPAFQRATQAICALESIHPKDPERVAALNEVATWIERNK
jgi:hypothetical protein